MQHMRHHKKGAKTPKPDIARYNRQYMRGYTTIYKKSACNPTKNRKHPNARTDTKTFNNLSDRPQAYYHIITANTRGFSARGGII